MFFSTDPAIKAVRLYQTQTRIAELNKKVGIKSIQNQVDRVEISSKARQLAQLKTISNAIDKRVLADLAANRIVE